MSGSISDILSVGKNIVTAISQLATTFLNVSGTQIVKNITTSTLIKTGPGRIGSVVVVVSGTTDGAIHDAINLAAVSAATKIWNINLAATGSNNTSIPAAINLPFADGLVVVPGTGMTVLVSYS